MASSRVNAASTKWKATKLDQPVLKDFPWTFQADASVVYRGKGEGEGPERTPPKKAQDQDQRLGDFYNPGETAIWIKLPNTDVRTLLPAKYICKDLTFWKSRVLALRASWLILPSPVRSLFKLRWNLARFCSSWIH